MRGRFWKGVVPGAMAVGAVAAVLAPAGPDALMPFRDAVAVAADQVSVAFVVDFGGGDVVSACVNVPAGASGYQALTDFTQQEVEAAPTFNSSGLLCSINGTPTSGCGQVVDGGYEYWSYWHGTTGSWVYANAGASAAVGNGDIEGWRFQDPGRGNPSDPAPGAAPTYASICVPTPNPPPTTPPPAPAPVSSTAPVSPPSGGGSGPGPTGSGAGSIGTTPGGASSPTTSPTASTNGAGDPAGGKAGSNQESKTSGSGEHAQSLGASPVSDRQGGGGSPLPLVIGGIIVAVLLTGAVFGWRRRPRTP
jgi:hypothetical protein